MRLVLVGTSVERARLRRGLDMASFTIAGEAESLAAARAAGFDADAFLLGTGTGVVASASTGGSVGRAVADTTLLSTAATSSMPEEALTPREMQVLELLAEGMPNKAIARRLSISDQTVKFHVASICGKLGAINRTDAVRRAVQRGIVAL